MFGKLFLITVAALGVGCSRNTSRETCPGGLTESGGQCRCLCDDTPDCATCGTGLSCSADGLCLPGNGPTITAVTGNDPSNASRVLDGLIVTGTLLTNATYELRSTTETFSLTSRSSSDSGAEVILPPAIRSGSYTLVATNLAGDAIAPVQLTLPELDGETLLTRINTQATSQVAFARLPTGTVAATVAAGDHAHANYLPLSGGTVTGNLTTTGDVTAGGELRVTGAINGAQIGYARNPLVLGGIAEYGCHGSPTWNTGFVDFPAIFPTDPIVVATIDETGDDAGPTWVRHHRGIWRNRFGFRCDNQSDAIHWLAMEGGEFIIDGKQVKAGKLAGAANNSSVFFPNTVFNFAQAPVVIMTIDESDDNSGATLARIIGNVSTGGFQIWSDGTADTLHWIAMEPGVYQHGRYRWEAGVFNTNSACVSTCPNLAFTTTFTTRPSVVATVNDVNNSGATWVRSMAITPTTLSARVTTGLSTELIHYLALEELR